MATARTNSCPGNWERSCSRMTKPMVAVGALALTEQARLPLQSKLAD